MSAYWFSINICRQAFQRVFVGSELCDNPEWIEACVAQGVSAIATASKLMSWHSVLRPLAAPFLSDVQQLKRHTEVMVRLAKPILDVSILTSFRVLESY